MKLLSRWDIGSRRRNEAEVRWRGPILLPESASSRRRLRAFTMVEIALCIAVIGFALVAIVGVLPLGMQVQRDNREETIINHDGPFLLEAIRNGKNVQDLTNFVEQITLLRNAQAPKVFNNFATGLEIIGLLSNPTTATNEAIVRSLNGPAAEKGSVRGDLAFRYKLSAQVRPFNSFDPNLPPSILTTWQSNMSHEVRLTFRYPLLPGNKTGTGKKVFRGLVTGKLAISQNPNEDELWFFESANSFVNLP